MELMAKVMDEVGDPVSGALHLGKVIAMIIQSGGIDSPSIISSHVLTFQMLFNAREFDEAAKHMCADIYLMELISGSRRTELRNHKLGTL